MTKTFGTLLNLVREGKPLVHHITNYVTVTDCANITFGIGASPVVISGAVDTISDADCCDWWHKQKHRSAF